jgi:SAM-dependent methyltransferase
MSLRGESYDARFARLEAEGLYLHGEADLVDSLAGGGRRRILDAGCGTGRVAIELARRGHEVVGVDVDPVMLASARAKAPDLVWIQADLADPGLDVGAPFDVVVAAGNVMIFVAPEAVPAVVENLAGRLAVGGLLVAGFQLGSPLRLTDYDAMATRAGLLLAHRWATWERDPYRDGDYAVSVHTRASPP